MAAFSIVLYIDSFIILLIIAMGDAMQPALSYNYAKKDFSRIKAIVKVVIFCWGIFIFIFYSINIDIWRKFNHAFYKRKQSRI